MKSQNEKIAKVILSLSDSEQLGHCECTEVPASLAFDSASSVVWARLLRAAESQQSPDSTGLLRYRIWAETLRGALMSVIEDLDSRPDENTRRNVVSVANSLAAFCEIQRLFDSDI